MIAPPMLLLPAPLTPASTVIAKAPLASAARLALLAGSRDGGPAKLLRGGIERGHHSPLRLGPLHGGEQLVEARFEGAQPRLPRAGKLLEIVEREDHDPRRIVLRDDDRAAGCGPVDDRAGSVLEPTCRHTFKAPHLAAGI